MGIFMGIGFDWGYWFMTTLPFRPCDYAQLWDSETGKIYSLTRPKRVQERRVQAQNAARAMAERMAAKRALKDATAKQKTEKALSVINDVLFLKLKAVFASVRAPTCAPRPCCRRRHRASPACQSPPGPEKTPASPSPKIIPPARRAPNARRERFGGRGRRRARRCASMI